MFELVDDLSTEDLETWLSEMTAPVEYLGDGAFAVTASLIPCDEPGSDVDKVDIVKDNKVIEGVI
ncbi:MAG: hypothetical protein DIU68_009015 [Chloroflexota bacterium]|nr:MAG: hypothetical protein DIU68_10930 [Chloroflexota bacterium]